MSFIKPGHVHFDSTLVGAPKLEEFPPLAAAELQQLFETPIREALARGVPPQTACCAQGIPLAYVARLIRTVHLMAEEVTRLMDLVVEIEKAESISPDLQAKLTASVPPPTIKVADVQEMPES